MKPTPEYVMKRLIHLVKDDADKDEFLRILDEVLTEAWEEGYDIASDNYNF